LREIVPEDIAPRERLPSPQAWQARKMLLHFRNVMKEHEKISIRIFSTVPKEREKMAIRLFLSCHSDRNNIEDG
jgi:hypothetical protein